MTFDDLWQWPFLDSLVFPFFFFSGCDPDVDADSDTEVRPRGRRAFECARGNAAKRSALSNYRITGPDHLPLHPLYYPPG